MMMMKIKGMMNRDGRRFGRGVVALPWQERRATAVLALGLVMASLLIIAAIGLDAHGAVTSDPMGTVKSTVNQVVGVLQDRSAPQEARRERLLQAVAGRFDFADMARQTLGVHWKDLTPGQQQEFVPLFTAFMEDAYLSKIEDYSGQTINFLRQSSDGSGYAQVTTSVTQPDKQAVRVDYRLKQDGGDWKVYDVAVDDISITANYRNQFNRVINSQGYDALVNTMRSKQQELQNSLAG
jgi:phospholipid transport system substrate-binding protein